MASDARVSASLQECVDRQRSVLAEYIRTIDGLVAVLLDHESARTIRDETTPIPDSCVPVLTLMLQAAGSSSHTVVRLSDRPGLQTRDCYSIARSVVELAANVCYVMAVGPEAGERAARHARQKTFRDLTRESRIGESVIKMAFSSAPESSAIPGLDEELAEFTARGGREKGWVDASIDERIAAIEKLSPKALASLHWARFAIYRHSSEVLHGTFFSALHFFGLTNPSGGPRSLDEMSEALGQQHMLVLMSIALAISGIIQSFHAAYGFRSAAERDTQLLQTLRSIPLFETGRRSPA